MYSILVYLHKRHQILSHLLIDPFIMAVDSELFNLLDEISRQVDRRGVHIGEVSGGGYVRNITHVRNQAVRSKSTR